MSVTIEVSGTTVNRVVAPRLKELKERQCSLAELQASLVQLIEMCNAQNADVARALDNKKDKEWRATL